MVPALHARRGGGGGGGGGGGVTVVQASGCWRRPPRRAPLRRHLPSDRCDAPPAPLVTLRCRRPSPPSRPPTRAAARPAAPPAASQPSASSLAVRCSPAGRRCVTFATASSDVYGVPGRAARCEDEASRRGLLASPSSRRTWRRATRRRRPRARGSGGGAPTAVPATAAAPSARRRRRCCRGRSAPRRPPPPAVRRPLPLHLPLPGGMSAVLLGRDDATIAIHLLANAAKPSFMSAAPAAAAAAAVAGPTLAGRRPGVVAPRHQGGRASLGGDSLHGHGHGTVRRPAGGRRGRRGDALSKQHLGRRRASSMRSATTPSHARSSRSSTTPSGTESARPAAARRRRRRRRRNRGG